MVKYYKNIPQGSEKDLKKILLVNSQSKFITSHPGCL